MRRKVLALWLLALLAQPGVALAQEGPGATDLSIWVIISTIIYGLIGISLCVAGYFAFDRIAGLSLRRELVEDQNVALGIMLAGVFIGIAIVVGAVMLS